MAKTKVFSPQDIRIFKLAKRIQELFTEDELRRLATVDPYTIARWANEEHSPRGNSAIGLGQIIAVKDSSLQSYYDGEIDLETLWGRRNESPRIKIASSTNYDDIAWVAKNLSDRERFKLARLMLETVAPHDLVPDTNPKKVLSSQQKTRLKTLLIESLRYQELDLRAIIEQGADPSLVDDIARDYEKDYSAQAYETLLPFINKSLQWVKDNLVVVSPSEQISSVDELWKEIEPPQS